MTALDYLDTPAEDPHVYGILPTGHARLARMRATMQEPRPTYRAPKHLGPGTTSTPRPPARRTRRRLS